MLAQFAVEEVKRLRQESDAHMAEAQQLIETLTAERDSVCSAVYPQWMANGWSVRTVALLAQAHRGDSLSRDTEEDQP